MSEVDPNSVKSLVLAMSIQQPKCKVPLTMSWMAVSACSCESFWASIKVEISLSMVDPWSDPALNEEGGRIGAK